MYNVLHGPYTLQKSRSSSDVELIVRSDCPQVDFPSRDPECLSFCVADVGGRRDFELLRLPPCCAAVREIIVYVRLWELRVELM